MTIHYNFSVLILNFEAPPMVAVIYLWPQVLGHQWTAGNEGSRIGVGGQKSYGRKHPEIVRSRGSFKASL
jgi:hypothetical protein